MPVFSLDHGRLTPARPSLSQNDEIVRETLMAVRDQVVELIYRPIFPVAWLTETSRSARRHTSLVAMDPSGKTVTVDVVDTLDTSILMGSLARASRHEEIPRGQLSGLYPRGATAFRKDWQEFLDSCPSGLEEHPRLIILAATVDDDVRAALDSLVGASIEVHRIDIHESRSGLLVSLEQVRPHEASFLAIGQAVRRGEISPPDSQTAPDEASPESPDQATDLDQASEPSPDQVSAPGPSAGSAEDHSAPSPDQASAVSSASPQSSASPDDPVVFVRRGGRATPHRAPSPSTDSAPSSERIGLGETAAEESDWRVAGAGERDRRLADAAAEITGDHGGMTPEQRVVEAIRAADDDSDRLSSAEHDLWDRPTAMWPQRTTELQAVAARAGEQTLTFKSLRRRVNATALLTGAGEIVLENGDVYSDPDEAASAVAGRQMDGWKNWRTESGERLSELRR